MWMNIRRGKWFPVTVVVSHCYRLCKQSLFCVLVDGGLCCRKFSQLVGGPGKSYSVFILSIFFSEHHPMIITQSVFCFSLYFWLFCFLLCSSSTPAKIHSIHCTYAKSHLWNREEDCIVPPPPAQVSKHFFMPHWWCHYNLKDWRVWHTFALPLSCPHLHPTGRFVPECISTRSCQSHSSICTGNSGASDFKHNDLQ